ncbi:hypothetical protein HJG60_010778 [Phyllostomus discolor]|uniref:Uncharacterized protein n=1 Tax=Phyllostomus discolor TaxID=89673 RepID=A0A834AH88_9CHIR|nr:hypothetical protein HJG60_010778 [Phyllostomus discolor]
MGPLPSDQTHPFSVCALPRGAHGPAVILHPREPSLSTRHQVAGTPDASCCSAFSALLCPLHRLRGTVGAEGVLPPPPKVTYGQFLHAADLLALSEGVLCPGVWTGLWFVADLKWQGADTPEHSPDPQPRGAGGLGGKCCPAMPSVGQLPGLCPTSRGLAVD